MPLSINFNKSQLDEQASLGISLYFPSHPLPQIVPFSKSSTGSPDSQLSAHSCPFELFIPQIL